MQLQERIPLGIFKNYLQLQLHDSWFSNLNVTISKRMVFVSILVLSLIYLTGGGVFVCFHGLDNALGDKHYPLVMCWNESCFKNQEATKDHFKHNHLSAPKSQRFLRFVIAMPIADSRNRSDFRDKRKQCCIAI